MSLSSSESILGYQISTKDVKGCITQISAWIDNGDRQKIFVCANPHSLVVARHDFVFQQALHSSDLVTPDGVGIVMASKMLGGTIHQRVTGSDIFKGLSEQLNSMGGRSCFFLGSTEQTLEAIKLKMAGEYPNVIFAGAYSPPYKFEFSEEDSALMIEAVNKVAPDVLWVGMTAPKQEKWLFQHKDKIDVKFAGAIGAVFDFYAGNVKRSHPFFQKMGLEWLPRLIQEPRRLFRRNFVSSPLFLLRIIQQRFNL